MVVIFFFSLILFIISTKLNARTALLYFLHFSTGLSDIQLRHKSKRARKFNSNFKARAALKIATTGKKHALDLDAWLNKVKALIEKCLRGHRMVFCELIKELNSRVG